MADFSTNRKVWVQIDGGRYLSSFFVEGSGGYLTSSQTGKALMKMITMTTTMTIIMLQDNKMEVLNLNCEGPKVNCNCKIGYIQIVKMVQSFPKRHPTCSRQHYELLINGRHATSNYHTSLQLTYKTTMLPKRNDISFNYLWNLKKPCYQVRQYTHKNLHAIVTNSIE